MELNYTGLKCDHCSYRDDSIEFKDYINNINKPCPDCGHNLLTQQEYNSCLKNVNIVKNINIILNIFKWINPLYYIKLLFGKKYQNYDEISISKRYANPSTNDKDIITITKTN